MGFIDKFTSKVVPDRPVLNNVKSGRIILSLLATTRDKLRPIELAKDWHDKHEASQLDKDYVKCCEDLRKQHFLIAIPDKKFKKAKQRYFYRLDYDRLVNEFSHYLSQYKRYKPLTKKGKSNFSELLKSELCKKFMQTEPKSKDSSRHLFSIIFSLIERPDLRVKKISDENIKLIEEARKEIENVPYIQIYWNELKPQP